MATINHYDHLVRKELNRASDYEDIIGTLCLYLNQAGFSSIGDAAEQARFRIEENIEKEPTK